MHEISINTENFKAVAQFMAYIFSQKNGQSIFLTVEKQAGCCAPAIGHF